jgi:hypothetical protein
MIERQIDIEITDPSLRFWKWNFPVMLLTDLQKVKTSE